MPRTINYIDAITEALDQEMERDDRVFIMGEDIGPSGGVFKATAGLFDKYGEDRVLDTPLAENNIIASAIGAAMVGLRPVPEIQFADFITPAMDTIVQQAAKIHYRSAGAYTCPITIRICCGASSGSAPVSLAAGARRAVRMPMTSRRRAAHNAARRSSASERNASASHRVWPHEYRPVHCGGF